MSSANGGGVTRRGLNPPVVERGKVEDVPARRDFGVVLLLVLVSASVQVAAPDADWAQVVTIALAAAILSMSARAARAEHPVVRAAVVAAIVLAVVSIVVVVVRGDVPKASAALVNGLLLAFTPAVIASGLLRDIRSEGEVTIRALSGVLAIYLLIGMIFSFADAAVSVLESGPFFANDPDPTRSDFLYFSYITLSTVGYGDLAPVSDVGRMLAVTESLIGEVYLVTVVALIVANLRPGERGPFQGRRLPEPPT